MTRRLAAIMFADIVGFSRQMGANEARTLRLLEAHNQVIQQSVAEHHGHVIKIAGDGFLVDFPSVVHAVQCAQHVQARFRAHNTEKESAEQIHVRIGIHSGDVVQREGDVFGDGVNIASRLQALAEPDTICISHKVYEEVEQKLVLGTVVSLGRPKLKNIAQRQRVYALLPAKPEGFRQRLRVQRLKLKPWYRTVQMAAILMLLGAGVLLRTFYFPPPPALSLPDKPSLVVLPFTNMSADAKQEYFSDGLSEILTSELSKLPGLFVISRNSAFTYKGKAVKVQEVGRELGVQYVLEGSVLRAGDQLRITAQLIDAAQDHHLWAERYDRPLKDIFALQDEIVQKIGTTLKLQLTLWEEGLPVRKRTDNLAAYDYFLRGTEYCCRFTKEDNALARQMYEKALALDPQYAEAYAWLGVTYLQEWLFQWSPDPQNLERAFALAQKALALDDSLPAAHQLLSQIYLVKKQYDPARAEVERALALDPNFADAYMVMGNILNCVGRPQETLRVMEKALRLNPHYPAWYSLPLGFAYWLTGRPQEAIAEAKRAIARVPNLRPAHGILAISYSELGREAEARAEGAEMLRISPNLSLEFLRQNSPYTDPAVTERWLAALRKAGLQ